MVDKRRTQMKKIIVLAAVSGFVPLWAATYYVSPTGNDNNSGLSQTLAWQTAGRVNQASFGAGDTLCFAGGKTFAGPLEIGQDDRGSPGSPMVITSFGGGRAVIDGKDLHAIVIDRTAHITLRNVDVVGLGIQTGQQPRGAGVRILGSSFVTVDSVEASGFRWAGIEITSSSDTRITHAFVHDNGYAGIRGSRGTPRLYIGYCRAIHNPGDPNYTRNISGSGIELYDASDAVVEFCEAAYNGGGQSPRGNGPVGIWIAGSHDVIIQYCISHHNTNPTADGGGIDIDAESYSNIVQYNYCYDNKSYGVQLWQWGGDRPLEKNTIRYNILENLKENDAHGCIWIGHNDDARTGVRDNDFYNNLVINEGPAIGISGSDVTNLRFWNNIFVADSGAFLRGATENQNFSFCGNCYYSPDGRFHMYDKYSSLEQWASESGQEKVDGRIAGVAGDPQITPAVDRAQKLTDPARLPQLMDFLFKETSPCIDRGIDIKSLFKCDPGTHDLLGRQAPAGTGWDIGPFEFQK